MPTYVTPVQIKDVDQARQTVRQAAQVLNDGGLVVFPTETVYGIAASAVSEAGIKALRAFKARGDNQPFTVHIPDPDAAHRYIDATSPALQRLIHKVFPGPVTLVVDVPESAVLARLDAMGLPEEARDRIYHQNTVGLRCPDMPVAQQLLAAVNAPVLASSANRRGQPPPHNADEAARAVGQAARLVIDAGRCRFAKPSTVVRVGKDHDRPRVTIERKGVYDERWVRKLTRWTALFICSGNTCRSAMAEAIAKHLMAQNKGLRAKDLDLAGIAFQSAGVFAGFGMPASPEAVEALRPYDIDLGRHSAQPVTPELIHEADVIFCMTQAHCLAVARLIPSAAKKVRLLDPNGDITDPVGYGAESYQQCAALIHRCVTQQLKEQGVL